ncbi:hypothetical protein [Shewanella woodyi]|uniref:hypothetical protein n=1 Tax=Shewanella woodyi TaxID=60961 RepID=UPI00374A5033
MFEPFLTQPEIIKVDKQCKLRVSLHETTADFSLLQVMDGHIGEFIVVSVAPTELSIMVRLHPFLCVNVESSSSEPEEAESVSRCVGQGWRLFSSLGVSPSMCAQELKRGVSITLSFDKFVHFSLEGGSQWEMVPLEKDNRLFHGPRELLEARALVARGVNYELSSEQLLLNISELEKVRGQLIKFGESVSVLGQARLSDEVQDLSAQLTRKKQWLSREYHHSVERLNWQTSANHGQKHDLQSRQLEYYRLLSTTATNEMVQQLIKDEE